MQFHPHKPGNPLYCHQEFLEKLEQNRNTPVGKRAALLLQRLLVNERQQPFKATRGGNRGWRRSRLGGNGGSHFYAWWAPKGAPPLQGAVEFDNAPAGAVFVRDIRHHDDHSGLTPQSLSEHYIELQAPDVKGDGYAPAPWTETQAQFASAKARVRILKGHPGSGKTTALWNAAEAAGQKNILYVTYSRELASLARDHFDKLATDQKNFRVLPFPRLVRELTGAQTEYEPVRVSRSRFVKESACVPGRVLLPWHERRGALFDEIYAHLVGEAVPAGAGRFEPSTDPWLAPRLYRERRSRALGGPAVDAVLSAWETLRKREGTNITAEFFPELWLAWRAASQDPPLHFLAYDCIAVDEVQDLTPVEALVLVRLAAAAREKGQTVTFLAAGDEAQTVRPSDFEWGWLNDMLHQHLGRPQEFNLERNLRSPRRIASVVNRVWDLYSQLDKQDRPGGSGESEVDEDSADQVMYCTAAPGPELEELLETLVQREGLAVITLEEPLPSWIPKRLHQSILTPAEAKGLDFSAVCLLDAGEALDKIQAEPDYAGRAADVEPLAKRLAIDQLRVALSRPTDRIYWVDVMPDFNIVDQVVDFLRDSESEDEVSPVVPALLLKTLEEELLDPAERVRLCETDARQLLEVKPAMAWSRAEQAVALARSMAGSDPAILVSAQTTLAQISFSLAFRNVDLPEEMGSPLFYVIAENAALAAGLEGTADVIQKIGLLELYGRQKRADQAPTVAATLAYHADSIAPWLIDEIGDQAEAWIQHWEELAEQPASAQGIVADLPAIYELFDVPDREQRLQRVRRASVQSLAAKGHFEQALQLLRKEDAPPAALLAQCEEGVGDHAEAAVHFVEAGDTAAALRCFRAVPDLENALRLLDATPSTPAATALDWLRRLRDLIAERPADFDAVATPAEKALLQRSLETLLDTPKKQGSPRRRH